ncbi:MAG: hypothetical protein HFI41_13820 [Lachnospiraceae bacterium]|nr:hypothetical protein [Lachnospiraceae bacterium]
MAKCYNCKNSFDYEKYYGICPKCSAYNKEKLPEEEHEELHEQYDSQKACGNLNGQGYCEAPDSAQEYYRGPDSAQGYQYVPGPEQYSGSYGSGQRPEMQGGRPKSSSASIAVFIFLILGIVAAIGMPIVYLVGKSMDLGARIVKDAAVEAREWKEEQEEPPAVELQQPRQSVEITETGIHKTCLLGKGQKMCLTVMEQPYVKIPAGQVEGFPQGENLVAVPVSYQDESEGYSDYYPLGMIYAGYGEQMYRSMMDSYDLEGYEEELGDTEIVDAYTIMWEGSGQGELLVFLPEDITGFSLYLESRDEDTYQMLGLYSIPLEIQN